MRKKRYYGPINVTWLITDRCNYDCQFCFRFIDRRELSFDQAKKIIDKLVKAGVRKISWAGGEPLIWPGIVDLIEYTYSLGVDTMLITNGSLLADDLLEKLKKSLTWLNLPLEASTGAGNSLMTRKEGHFERVMEILQKLQDSRVRLKINTVASAININDIVDIVPIVRKYKVKRWKIFQFYCIRGASVVNQRRFSVSLEEFERVRGLVLPMFKNSDCMVVFENNGELEKSYFAIAPDGMVYVSYKGKDIFLGDLKRDTVDSIWGHKMLDKKKYWCRSKWVLKRKD